MADSSSQGQRRDEGFQPLSVGSTGVGHTPVTSQGPVWGLRVLDDKEDQAFGEMFF